MKKNSKKTDGSVKIYSVNHADELVKFSTREAAETASFIAESEIMENEISPEEFEILKDSGAFQDDEYLNQATPQAPELKIVEDATPKTELQLLHESVLLLQKQMKTLSEENEVLKKKDKKKLTLEESLKLFEHKKKLIDHLNLFQNTASEINKMEIQKDNLEFNVSDRYSLVLYKDYSRTELFKITNTFVLSEFREFILPLMRRGGELIWQIGTGYFGCRHADGSFSTTMTSSLLLK